MKKRYIIIGAVIAALFLVAFPFIVPSYNNYVHSVKDANNNTNYDIIKSVEDTCRAMISTYNADALTYVTYKDSEDDKLVSVALQAKIRANSTAIQYNQFILKNNYIWKNNVPEDIYSELSIVE